MSERLKEKELKRKRKEKEDYRKLIISQLLENLEEDDDTSSTIEIRKEFISGFDIKVLEELLAEQEQEDEQPTTKTSSSSSSSSSPSSSSRRGIPMANNDASSNSSSSSADPPIDENPGDFTPEERELYEQERWQILTLIGARDFTLASLLTRLDTKRVDLIKEFERISGSKYVKVPIVRSITSSTLQVTEGAAAASGINEQATKKAVDDKIVDSGIDNFGKSAGIDNDDNNIEAEFEEGKNKKPRKGVLGAPAAAAEALPLSTSSSAGQKPVPLSEIKTNKRARSSSAPTSDDDDDDEEHSKSQDLDEVVVVHPTPAHAGNRQGVKHQKSSSAAAGAASGKKVTKGKGSTSAAAGDNPRIPACLEVSRVHETLGLCDQISKEHKIVSAHEARGFTGKTTDYKACEMCIDKRIGNGRATSVCLGCSVLTHPQVLFYVCWDHALQHGMEVFKARYCQQCFREAQEDGNV